MGSSLTCLTDPKVPIVADASTVINLVATGCARKVLEALPNRLVIADVVPEELEGGRHRRRQDADLLSELVGSNLIEIVQLDEVSNQHFEQLVVGSATETLDDGEAATIAYAASQGGIALIDERKANRICAERFPELSVGCTVDIFAHPKVQHAFGTDGLADAVFNALCHGRMRVFPHHMDWVVSLIGADRACLCPSLPSSVRGLRPSGPTQADPKSSS